VTRCHEVTGKNVYGLPHDIKAKPGGAPGPRRQHHPAAATGHAPRTLPGGGPPGRLWRIPNRKPPIPSAAGPVPSPHRIDIPGMFLILALQAETPSHPSMAQGEKTSPLVNRRGLLLQGKEGEEEGSILYRPLRMAGPSLMEA
jgi:hypothetical protein